jgi:hypothetical protein
MKKLMTIQDNQSEERCFSLPIGWIQTEFLASASNVGIPIG